MTESVLHKQRDLRVTFDTNIRSEEDLRLEAGDHGRTLPNDDLWLMEVMQRKPFLGSRLLSEFKLFKTSFPNTEQNKTMIKENLLRE